MPLHPTLNWDSPALNDAWTQFKQHARLMFIGPLNNKTEVQTVSYLLLWVGKKGRDIYSTFQFTSRRTTPSAQHEYDDVASDTTEAENRNNLDTVCTKFREYVTPKSNVIFSRCKLYNRTQGVNEPVESFIMDIKLLASDCGFPSNIIDEMIRDRLVYGTNARKVRERFINYGAELILISAIN